jgi:hypothetical protein
MAATDQKDRTKEVDQSALVSHSQSPNDGAKFADDREAGADAVEIAKVERAYRCAKLLRTGNRHDGLLSAVTLTFGP